MCDSEKVIENHRFTKISFGNKKLNKTSVKPK